MRWQPRCPQATRHIDQHAIISCNEWYTNSFMLVVLWLGVCINQVLRRRCACKI